MRTILCSLCFCAAMGCSSKAGTPPPVVHEVSPHDDAGRAHSNARDGSAPGSDSATKATARTKHLQWKRADALEADLSAALELPPAQLCREFGVKPCIRDVHLVPLGGYDALASGMLEGAPDPIVTTPTAVERVVLSACSRRVELDRTSATKSALLSALELDAPAPAADSAAMHEFVSALYRRLLARDPSDDEVREIATLSADVSADEFAKLACFTVGTLSEFLFF